MPSRNRPLMIRSVVLWGGRRGDVQACSREDRERQELREWAQRWAWRMLRRSRADA